MVASGSLPKTDYYCPNIKCNAVLRLVDCDDAIKKITLGLSQDITTLITVHIPMILGLLFIMLFLCGLIMT